MLTRGDDTDLLAALYAGERQTPRWAGLLNALKRRANADGATLAFNAGAPAPERAAWWSDDGKEPPLAASLAAMRPNRVYAAEELGFDDCFLRAVRVGEPDVWTAWLIVQRSASDFAAADGARLSALAPHLFIAMGAFAALEHERMQLACANEALRRAGVSWRALSEQGQIVASNAPTIRAPTSTIVVPAPGVATLELSRNEQSLRPEALGVLQKLWALSAGEARLALAIANGESLAEAATSTGLTLETARNYSKRIYAKSGARGMPDLVRMILQSAATLA